MKKNLSLMFLVVLLILGGCVFHPQPNLQGFYQSEEDINGYFVQLTVQQDDSSFVEYIDNREVDKGNVIKKEDGRYLLEGEHQSIDVYLNSDNSFDIVVKKLNNGNPIKMVHTNDVPVYFPKYFDDVDFYQTLIEE